VQVYDNTALPGSNKSEKNNGVILTPNQKVVYKEAERQFTATIVANPQPLVAAGNAAAPPVQLIFEETPLREVLKTLEKNYGLEIMVENEKMYNCLFTGDVTRMDLFSKLDVICQSVKASYQVAGTKILIEGKGCN
jgi:hypothetical protein